MDHRLLTDNHEHTISYFLGIFCIAADCIFNMDYASG